MQWIEDVDAVRRMVAETRAQQQTLGLVPTMGALHRGHVALLHALRPEVDRLVLSIFVNPTQFGPREDFAQYPRDLASDRAWVEAAHVDAVFYPATSVMYPIPPTTFVQVEGIDQVLEGAVRPTHFRGVATVVSKLLNLWTPDVIALGQKDAQQVVVVRRMLQELLWPTRLVVVPTVREPDGLALSSRNVYLSPAERQAAVVLHRSLDAVEQTVRRGERDGAVLAAELAAAIQAEPLAQLDYAVVVDAATLAPVTRLAGRVLVAVAARFGATRLLDNCCLAVDDDDVRAVLP